MKRAKKPIAIMLSILMMLGSVPAYAEVPEAIPETETIEAEVSEESAEELAIIEETEVIETDIVESEIIETERIETKETVESEIAEKEAIEETELLDEVELYAASGTCGATMTWQLNDQGTLTISGTGKMDDFKEDTIPWLEQRDSIKKVIIGSGVQSIGVRAFTNCTALTSVSIPNTVTVIDVGAFNTCSSLESINIPSSVTKIGGWAFQRTGLKNIVFPDNVTVIPQNACYQCKQLESITFPKNLKSIESSAFYDCSALKALDFPDTLEKIIGSFDACKGLEEVILPDSLTYLGSGTFSDCTNLKKVVIPEKVTSIETYTFFSCDNLETVVMSDNVTTIDSNAFSYCYALKNFELPANLQKVGVDAFRVCESLTSLRLPKTLTSIGKDAFAFCSGVERIDYNGTLSDWCKITFNNNDGLTKTKIPLYINNVAVEDLVIPSDITEVKDNTFARISSIKTLTIPSHVKRIGSHAFYGASNLKTIDFEEGVEELGDHAFSFCSNLDTVLLPKSVKRLEDSVFTTSNRLWDVIFFGNAPTFSEKAFQYQKLNIYYMGTDPTWTEEVRQPYGGSDITYIDLSDKPAITKIANTVAGIKVTWDKLPNVTGYQIFRQRKGDPDYILIREINNPEATGYVDGDILVNEVYTYKIKTTFVNGHTQFGDASKQILRILHPGMDKPINTSTGIKVTWKKVSNASGYDIYAAIDDGSYSKIATVKGGDTLSYLDETVKNGTKISYRVRAYKGVEGKKNLSTYSKVVTTYRLSKPVIEGTSYKKAKVNVTWKRNSKCDGYEIWYSTKSDFSTKTSVKVSGNTTINYAISGIAKGKTCYVKIRSYKVVDGVEIKSTWSSKVGQRT